MEASRFQKLQKAFEEKANPQQAEEMAAYMKNHFDFYGVPATERRSIYKSLLISDKKAKKIDWDLLDLAWQSPKRELHYFVCDYLRSMSKYLTYDNVPKILTYASSNQWWDSIDHFDHILGNISDARISQLMLDLSISDDMWMRRIAIDHQLGKKEKTNTKLLESIILNNLGSKEFFINKAIGWSLRDYSKVNPNWVKAFINTNQNQLAPLSIREASKYL